MTKQPLAITLLMLVLSAGVTAQHLSTRVVSGKGVYIFGPSVEEADTLALDEADALSDFSFYSNKFAAFVRANGLSCEYISASIIKIRYSSMRVFTVSRDSVEFGTILSDGVEEPLLLKYVEPDDTLEKACTEYFKLK